MTSHGEGSAQVLRRRCRETDRRRRCHSAMARVQVSERDQLILSRYGKATRLHRHPGVQQRAIPCPRTLASVLESCEAESEIIVVDDCSRLPVAGWLPSSMEGKARIIRHSVNRGPGAARNTGIGAARGKWIAFVDADDVIRAGRFEEMIDRAGGLGVDVIADDLEICIEGDQRTTSLFESRGLKLPEGAIEVSAEDFVGFDLGLLKPIVRSDALLRTGIRFSEDFRAGEDFHFMLNLILQGVRMGIIKDAFYVYTKPSLAQREKTLHNFRESLRATDSLIYNAAACPSPG